MKLARISGFFGRRIRVENEIYRSLSSRLPMARLSITSAGSSYIPDTGARFIYGLTNTTKVVATLVGGCISRAWNLTSAKVCVNRFLALRETETVVGGFLLFRLFHGYISFSRTYPRDVYNVEYSCREKKREKEEEGCTFLPPLSFSLSLSL